MKIRKEREFTPECDSSDEEEYQTQLRAFRAKLEKAYPLCLRCEMLVRSKELGKYNPFYHQRRILEQGFKTASDFLETASNSSVTPFKSCFYRTICASINAITDRKIFNFLLTKILKTSFLTSNFISDYLIKTSLYPVLFLIRLLVVPRLSVSREHALFSFFLLIADTICFYYFKSPSLPIVSHTVNVFYCFYGCFQDLSRKPEIEKKSPVRTSRAGSRVSSVFQPRREQKDLSSAFSQVNVRPARSQSSQSYVSRQSAKPVASTLFANPIPTPPASSLSRTRWSSAPSPPSGSIFQQQPKHNIFNQNPKMMDIDESDEERFPKRKISPFGSPTDTISPYDSASQIGSEVPTRLRNRKRINLERGSTISEEELTQTLLNNSNLTTTSIQLLKQKQDSQNKMILKIGLVLAVEIALGFALFYFYVQK